MRTLVGIFLIYTYYILGVPYLGFPVESLYTSPSKRWLYGVLSSLHEASLTDYGASSPFNDPCRMGGT